MGIIERIKDAIGFDDATQLEEYSKDLKKINKEEKIIKNAIKNKIFWNIRYYHPGDTESTDGWYPRPRKIVSKIAWENKYKPKMIKLLTEMQKSKRSHEKEINHLKSEIARKEKEKLKKII
jgi:hypothetical protein